MRKAWKWILLLLGVLLASAGLLVWDANARAARVIEAYEARLKADIAALRARFEVIPRTPDEDVLRFEMGHSGQGAVRNEVFASLRRNASSRAGSSPLEILGVLGKYELTLREGGYRVCSRRTDDEAAALRLLRSTLVDRPMEPHELRRIADGVDWLRSLRPSLADLVGAESALDRAEILNVFRLKQDPFGMIRKGPGWRELFSWRIRIAKSLALLDDSARELRGALLLPTADQKDCLVDFESPGEA
ncbi:MAG: hypothetical protein HY293_10500 [Planctomycetes bacterium]|nr:hypothetical protein [Planctomycetota bacterium]